MIRIPVCFSCKHFIADYSEKGVYKCKAFPEGIPETVFMSSIRDDKKGCTNGYRYIDMTHKQQ